MKGVVTMPDIKDDLHERLSSWRQVADRAREQSTRQQRPVTQGKELSILQLAEIVIWLAGLGACLTLAWHLSNGSPVLTALPLLLSGGTWKFVGLAWWGLLLPLSLIGLLAIHGAISL
jgi:hypothetical protein